MISNGDIFITKLERHFFGAFRILKTKGTFDFSNSDFCLFAVTPYIDVVKPRVTDVRLGEVLMEKRFFCNNVPCIRIYSCENIENRFEYLGNISLTDAEEKLEVKIGDGINGGFPLCRVIDTNFGNNAFLEWRWENERDDFQREVEEQKQKAKKQYENRELVPKQMMDDDLFWRIISLFNWDETDDTKIIAPAVKYLSKMKVSDIKQFEESLSFKLYCIDTKDHAKNIGEYSYNEKDDYVSVDFFLYARCAAVANGREFYEKVLKEPVQMPKDIDFEALLTLSSAAYELKVKSEFNYSTGCSYETYSNKAGWK